MQHILLSITLLATLALSHADTLTLADQNVVSGSVLRTNGSDILVLQDFGTVSVSNVATITFEHDEELVKGGDRLPDFKTILLRLNRQRWASNLKQIPATVIEDGPLRHVPYVSFRCGDDYEINIYGDLDRPAAIEAGVYRNLIRDPLAKSRCEDFISALLKTAQDKSTLGSLDWEKDLKRQEGFVFEVTPPTASDAYGGWWVSVYSEAELNRSRASEAELQDITARVGKSDTRSDSTWNATELALARPASPETITLTTSSGFVITNAEVVSINDGVSIVWRSGGAGGAANLAELSPELQSRFGYDPEKARAAEIAMRERRAREREQQVRELETARQQARETAASSVVTYAPRPTYVGGSSGTASFGGGRVFVRGYTRRDGTYVRPHTRSAPRRR